MNQKNRPPDVPLGSAVDGMTGGNSNAGANAAVSGTKYNWDDTGHNYLIDLLNYPPEQVEKMRKINFDYDHNKETQKDPKAHASSLGKITGTTEQDYIQKALQEYNEYPGVTYTSREKAIEAASQQYATDQEKLRSVIRDTCGNALQKAIDCKNAGDEEGSLRNLVIALHIVADDRTHRQSNNNWAEHASIDTITLPTGRTIIVHGVQVPETITYSTPSVDNMFNSGNFDKLKDSVIATGLVNDMYQNGNIDNTVVDRLFPQVGSNGLRVRSWTEFNYAES